MSPFLLVALLYAFWMAATDSYKRSLQQVPWRPFFLNLISSLDDALWRALGVQRSFHFTLPIEHYEPELRAGSCWAFGPHHLLLPGLLFALKAEREGVLERLGVKPGDALGAAAPSVFYIPLFRELILALGGRIASQSVLSRLNIFGVLPGGVHEMIRQTPNVDRLFLRRGFLRLAVRRRLPVVPCYLWGETSAYTPLASPHPVITAAQRWLHRCLGVGVPLWRGRWGVPMSPLPNKGDYIVAIGRPLRAPSGLDEEAQVDALFAACEGEQRRLFAELKELRPRAGLELVIEHLPSSRNGPSARSGN